MEIERTIDDLTIERWTFIILQNNIYLNSYVLLQKESKSKRNFNILMKYDRIFNRNSTIKESEVPFTNELKQDVLNKYISTIKVLKWSDKN